MKAWQAQIRFEMLCKESGFNKGDHVIFKGFNGEDIYGTIVNISDMDTHFRVRTDDGNGWHVDPSNMVYAD